MNMSAANVTVVLQYRDSFTKAVTKNVIVVVIGISINFINANLIHTFRKHQIFYMNPRYVLFIHLVVNDMIQMTLTVILFVVSYTLYKLNVSVCCIFILIALFTTENTPLNLACMAVECYIAICLPLRHMQICTVKRTLMLIGLIWMTSMFSVLPDLFITLATEPLDFFNSRVFCLRQTAFPHPLIVQKRDITYAVFLVIVWLTIFYTYFKILFTVKTASKDAKKARKTIMLHGFQLLLCMSSYATPQLKEALLRWFPKNYADSLFAIYITVQILPRSISPIIYGIRDNTFRKYLKKYLLCRSANVNFSCQEMNMSAANVTVVLQYRDSFTKAVTKNVIVVVLGISINYINANLIHTFRKHQIFYMNPRYVLFIHLVVNDMIQMTLTVILFVISYTLYKLNVSVCCIFILIALFTTENTPLNLACMAVECYIAICLPLRHMQICTVSKP
ncbi:PREDICTED: G-protein coupled receptor 183-like [Scomber scombrus]|uniref:PREDICTED: G-protein coupled receptor 183-like n=1 Tax=Scomber scombrus TaxID=13677 RepID=A0AAV1PSM0_SCOSC